MKKIKFFPIRFGFMLFFVCIMALSADAANFTVNSIANTPDVNTADNICADQAAAALYGRRFNRRTLPPEPTRLISIRLFSARHKQFC